MFNKKSPKVEPEVKLEKPKTKTDFMNYPKLNIASEETSFLNRLQ
jgi:hypothetical protein